MATLWLVQSKARAVETIQCAERGEAAQGYQGWIMVSLNMNWKHDSFCWVFPILTCQTDFFGPKWEIKLTVLHLKTCLTRAAELFWLTVVIWVTLKRADFSHCYLQSTFDGMCFAFLRKIIFYAVSFHAPSLSALVIVVLHQPSHVFWWTSSTNSKLSPRWVWFPCWQMISY